MRKLLLIVLITFLQTILFAQQIVLKERFIANGKSYFITLEKFNGKNLIFARKDLNRSQSEDIKIMEIKTKVIDKDQAMNMICRSKRVIDAGKKVIDAGKTVVGCAATFGTGVCFTTGGAAGLGVPVCLATITYTTSSGFVDCISGLTSIIGSHFGYDDFGIAFDQSTNSLSIMSLISNAIDSACEDWQLNRNSTVTQKTTSSIPTKGLVAFYPFNGDVNDESGNGNNGTIRGGVSKSNDRHGKANKAMQFNGSNGYILVPNSTSLQSPINALSVTSWIWIDGYNGLKAVGIINKTNTSSYGQYGLSYHEWSEPHRIGFNYNQGNKGIVASINLRLSMWHFVAAIYDGNYITIYVDGNKIGSTASTGSITKDDNPLTIGIDTPGSTEYLKGKLDDIRIFNRALTAQEVDALFKE